MSINALVLKTTRRKITSFGQGQILAILFLSNFIDSSLFPLPAQGLLVLVSIAERDRLIKYFTTSYLGSVAGAAAGYAAGYLIVCHGGTESNGFMRFLIGINPSINDGILKAQGFYSHWNFWILLASSIIPIPYGVLSLTSGIFGINLIPFLLITLIAQAFKLFVITNIIVRLGSEAMERLKYRLRDLIPYSLVLGMAGLAIMFIIKTLKEIL
jgi:membrane protein YqaA with SNARE-associated domain